MKKTLALALALVMCLTLIPLTAHAYGNEWIQLDKNNYDPGEAMVITIKGVTQQMIDHKDGLGYGACIGIFQKDLSGLTAGEGYYTVRETGDYVFNQFDINAPAEPGEYAIALFREKPNHPVQPADVLVTHVLFTVGGAAKDGHISLDKTAYTAMESIIVSYSGITQSMVNSNAVVVIIDKANPINSYGATRVNLGSGTITTSAPNRNGEFEMRLYSVSVNNAYTADSLVMSVPFTVSGASTVSEWATKDLERANALGLIPDSLKGQDMTKPITRAEFAAVAVLLYENLTGTKTTPSPDNTFTDTKDNMVLRAHNTGLMVGVSATEFQPDTLLNREQAATALTRTLKRAYIPGWTFATDGQFTINFTRPAPFADDANISDWAKDSVYFMAANSIILGVGNNNFAPRAITSAEQATGYASATREQAIIIGLRIVDNLKDKPIDYTQR
jgi:hypothetical protein